MAKDSVIGSDTINNALKWLWSKCKDTFSTKVVATRLSNGLMSAADKAKVDGFGAATEYAKKAEVAVKPIVYQNITVPASAWGGGAGYAGATRTKYADIALDGVTSDLYATVTFNPDDIDNYNLAGICATKAGKITIYAEYAPSVAITIPTIVVGGEADNNLEKPTIIMSATPHNYLDNSNFANPVNQRGKTTYTGSGYTIDRWRMWHDGSSLSVVAGGVTVSGEALFSYIELGTVNKNGLYTIAAKAADGTTEVVSGTPQAGVFGTMCTLSYDANVDKVWVALKPGYTYVWAALYEGEYTKDTLPPYQPKGYAAELMECYRYFYRAGGTAYEGINSGTYRESKKVETVVKLPVKMRTDPYVTYGGEFMMVPYFDKTTSVSCDIIRANAVTVFFVMQTERPVASAIVAMADAVNIGYIDFSADL